jgi:NADH dehydrogenase (ubiquinone) Fe-S protein 1
VSQTSSNLDLTLAVTLTVTLVSPLQKAVPVPGDGRDDWKILRALSEVAGAPLPYNSVVGVRERLATVAPHMGEVKAVEAPLWLNGEYFKVRRT